ncbi:hypothetical protein L6164_035679 [Bauhinia variegata]|uniref:Uncharacterized protein n=1 Tax=Bauhinia variegata TaxID=167791 RepID=A0ACB9KEQ6_BAUVA|nr:hypothetical protein L6164_035679 [Bauhinia variegata]
MASSTYSTASAPFSLSRSRTLSNPTSYFSNSLRQHNPTPGSSFRFPLQRAQKGFKVQNRPLIPMIQCIRETRGNSFL